MTIEKFEDELARDEAALGGEHALIGTEECWFESYEIPNQDPPVFTLAPKDTNIEYLLTINGADAESQRMHLPICD